MLVAADFQRTLNARRPPPDRRVLRYPPQALNRPGARLGPRESEAGPRIAPDEIRRLSGAKLRIVPHLMPLHLPNKNKHPSTQSDRFMVLPVRPPVPPDHNLL